MTIQQLRERRNEIAKEMRNLLDTNKDSASWKTNGCKAKWDELEQQCVDLDDQIDREQRLLDLNAEDKFRQIENGGHPSNGRPASRPSAGREQYDRWMRRGDNALSAEEWGKIRNDLSVGGDGSEGGYTVQTDVASTVIEALKFYGGMRQVGEVFSTGQGNPLQFPTSDGTSEVGEIVGENASASDADTTFGTVGVPVYKYGSKVIPISIELLQDSGIDMPTFLNNRIQTRIGRITNTHFTTGSGTNQPRGLVTALSVGRTGATGQTTSIIYDDLVELAESIDEAYANASMKWMFHQSTRKVIRKLKDGNGRPIWTPSYDAGIQGNHPDQLLGYDIQINNDMAVMAANAKAIAFGDFSFYKIRDVMGITLYRFTDSAYTKKGQVGFMAWMRAGGNWTDIGGAAKVYQNSAT